MRDSDGVIGRKPKVGAPKKTAKALEKQLGEDPVFLDPAQNQENTPENLVEAQDGPEVDGEAWAKME